MKNFRLVIQLILLTFLLGKGVTTVIGVEISGLETVMEAVPADSAEQPVEEDDSTEEDDEVLNGVRTMPVLLLTSHLDATFYLRPPLESQQEVTVPPPQV